MSGLRNNGLDSPIYPFEHVDLNIEPKDEVDILIRRIIEYTKLKRQGYGYQEIMVMTDFPRGIAKLSSTNRRLLLALETRVFTARQILLFEKLFDFISYDHINDLVDKAVEGKLKAEELEEEANYLLEHYKRFKKKLGVGMTEEVQDAVSLL